MEIHCMDRWLSLFRKSCFLAVVICMSLFSAKVNAQLVTHEIPDAESCLQCHTESYYEGENAPVCHYYCVKCHSEMDRHHAVGVELEDDIQNDLRYYRNKEVSCFTCHNIYKSGLSDVPMRSQSLFHSFIGRKKQYRSYFLVKQNNKGQLCRSCH